MPEVDVLSKGANYSVYVIREYNPRTGLPRQHDVLAMVSFTQKEVVTDGLIYATHANYHVVQEKSGALGLERHMTMTEHGMHKVRELRQQRERLQTLEAIDEFTEELKGELSKLDEARPVEKEMGISVVTEKEAQQIIDFCRSLDRS